MNAISHIIISHKRDRLGSCWLHLELAHTAAMTPHTRITNKRRMFINKPNRLTLRRKEDSQTDEKDNDNDDDNDNYVLGF